MATWRLTVCPAVNVRVYIHTYSLTTHNLGGWILPILIKSILIKQFEYPQQYKALTFSVDSLHACFVIFEVKTSWGAFSTFWLYKHYGIRVIVRFRWAIFFYSFLSRNLFKEQRGSFQLNLNNCLFIIFAIVSSPQFAEVKVKLMYVCD